MMRRISNLNTRPVSTVSTAASPGRAARDLRVGEAKLLEEDDEVRAHEIDSLGLLERLKARGNERPLAIAASEYVDPRRFPKGQFGLDGCLQMAKLVVNVKGRAMAVEVLQNVASSFQVAFLD
jgi:hypothetical protein